MASSTLMFALLLSIGFFFQEQTFPKCELTPKSIIAVLADYDFKHTDQQPFFMPAFGVTNFESNPPAVWIFNTGDTHSKQATVIHELCHIYFRDRLMTPPEAWVGHEEERIYRDLFQPDLEDIKPTDGDGK